MAQGVRAHRGRPRRARDGDERPRHGGRVDPPPRSRARRHRGGPGARPAAPSQRRQDPAGRRRCRRRRGPADLLRRLQHGRRRPGAAGHARHRHGQRHEDRAPQAPGRVVERHALLGPRAGPRRRQRRHHDPRPVGDARGRPQDHAWASSTTCSTTSRSTPTGPTPCRWPAWPATWPPGSASRSPSWRPRSRRPRPPSTAGRRSRSWRPSCAGGSTGGCSTTSPSAPSPRWLADRLVALGMRPINCVVDASNYVMLELGQPSHTYDLAKLRDGHLRVRWARDGETIVTLDEVERTLSAGDGVMADADDVAVGIAGVMGGASTEISDATRSVLLEMAWWHPDDHRPVVQAAQPAQRGLGPLRARVRPRRRRAGRPALRRAAGAGRRHPRHRGHPGRRRPSGPHRGAGAHRPGERRARHRAHRGRTSPGCSARSGSRSRPGRRRRDRAARDGADASGPTPPPRST